MMRATVVMILVLLLGAITTQGIPIPGTQGRCLCPRTSSIPINPRYIKSLKYIPKGPHCETLEIIITMKNRSRVCVNPDADWVKIIIKATKGARQHN
ncbi:interleukin-8-like [Scyliorhinus canicula]|uniref:interleukin-8-like n=1 Tax=Scyliorhinus canicula TaxID=7830 RepID=UPI0018F742CF|nr:interleukin-8-like [Scyliorhinus canicula]